MIFDHIENADHYKTAHGLIEEAWTFLRNPDLASMPDGRYELSHGAYASVQSYLSRPVEDCSFESHRRYVDLQFIVDGEEWIYVSLPTELLTTQEYREEEDCALYSGSPKTRILMGRGSFLLLFPHDAHMPTVAVAGPASIKKVVVKLPA